jgi:hypothetical protein
MTPIRLYLLILAVAAVVTLAYFMLRRKPKTADDLERERRECLTGYRAHHRRHCN